MSGNASVKIAVIHDYADVFRTTRAYPRLQGHAVVIRTDLYTDPARVITQTVAISQEGAGSITIFALFRYCGRLVMREVCSRDKRHNHGARHQ